MQAVAVSERVRFGPGGGEYHIVATSAETGNLHFAFEATEPPGGGPPLHIHRNEEEFFVVTEGEMTFYIDGQIITRAAGESAFVPRGAAHCFKNRSNRIAKVLITFTPGNIEGFFDYGLPVGGAAPSEEHLQNRLVELAPKFGLEVLGPSPL
jgi:quercetin dioxygenase-like cupin family protein